MGNLCHAGPVELVPTPQVNASLAPPKKPLTFGKNPSLKREDIMFSNVKEPSLLTKLPGSINGQQFIIEDCSGCDIFLLDNCMSVQIDECVDCHIVVGSCQASLFLRNCKKCTIVCAVQQFRTRDCEDVDVYLYSTTAIRSSQLFRLEQQVERAHSSWTPLPMRSDESPLAPMMQTHDDGSVSLWKLSSTTAESLGLSIELSQLIVPLSCGVCARRERTPTVFVCFIVPREQLMMDFVTAAVSNTSEATAAIQLLRTRQLKLTAEQAKTLFVGNEQCIQEASEALEDTLGSVAMEFQGPDSHSRVSSVLSDEKFGSLLASHAVFFSPDDSAARRMSELVFHAWQPKI
ncbi:Xrp2-like protein, partial [Globisporangium splendens]